MNKRIISFRRCFMLTLVAFLLVGCGGKPLGDYDILKTEGELSGQEIPVGTYDSKSIVFAYKNTNSSFSTTELYVALDYSSSVAQSRHSLLDVEEYCYFFPELEEGRFQSSTVSFNYEATFDLEAGTASEISNATASTGTIAAGDTAFVEGFLDAAADGMKDYLDTYRDYQSKTEEWVVSRLEELGYELNSNYDRDSLDYMENQIYTNHGINVNVVKRYVGYINQSERFVEVIIFGSAEECGRYFYKVWTPGGNVNYNYHAHNDNLYFFTGSYETIQAIFPSHDNQP
ncbi:MAG: hypothetical protein WCR77_04005 [Bacilli bacterium]